MSYLWILYDNSISCICGFCMITGIHICLKLPAWIPPNLPEIVSMNSPMSHPYVTTCACFRERYSFSYLSQSLLWGEHGENILGGQMVWSGWQEWRQVWGVRGESGWWVCKMQVISKSNSYDATNVCLMEGSVEKNSCIVRLAVGFR